MMAFPKNKKTSEYSEYFTIVYMINSVHCKSIMLTKFTILSEYFQRNIEIQRMTEYFSLYTQRMTEYKFHVFSQDHVSFTQDHV